MSAVSFLNRNNHSFQFVELGDSLPADPNSLSARISKVASTAIHYAIFATICGGSVYFFSPIRIIGLSIALVGGTGFYIVRSIRAVTAVEIPVEDIKVKAERIARVAFLVLLIVIPSLTGAVGRELFYCAAFFLYGTRTATALTVLREISCVTTVLGRIIPFIKLLLKHSNYFHENYNNQVRRLENTIQSFQNQPSSLSSGFIDALRTILARLNLSSPDGFDFNTIIEVGQNLDKSFLREQFIHNLNNLSRERISEVISNFPEVFTIDFLAKSLAEEEFRAIFESKFNLPSKDQLEEISKHVEMDEQKLTELEQELTKFEENRGAFLKKINSLAEEKFRAIFESKFNLPSKDQLKEISKHVEMDEQELTKLEQELTKLEDNRDNFLKEAEELSETIYEHANKVRRFLSHIQKIPKKVLPEKYSDIQKQIDDFKGSENSIEESYEKRVKKLAKKLTGQEDGSLSLRLQRLSSLVSLQDNSPDKEELSYVILGAYFREPDFKRLGLRLGLAEEDLRGHEIQKTYEHLERHGLSNHGDLIRHGILAPSKDGQNLTVDKISRRIVDFCTKVKPQADQAASYLQVESEREAQEIAAQPQWIFIANTVNDVFHIMLSGGLIAFQISQQPISTLAGFVLRLWTDNPDFSRLNFLSNLILSPLLLTPSLRVFIGPTVLHRQLLPYFYQSPPSYIHQGFTELMQELSNRIWVVLLSIDFNFIGGVISGFHHANALFNYFQSRQNPFRRWRIARA